MCVHLVACIAEFMMGLCPLIFASVYDSIGNTRGQEVRVKTGVPVPHGTPSLWIALVMRCTFRRGCRLCSQPHFQNPWPGEVGGLPEATWWLARAAWLGAPAEEPSAAHSPKNRTEMLAMTGSVTFLSILAYAPLVALFPKAPKEEKPMELEACATLLPRAQATSARMLPFLALSPGRCRCGWCAASHVVRCPPRQLGGI